MKVIPVANNRINLEMENGTIINLTDDGKELELTINPFNGNSLSISRINYYSIRIKAKEKKK